MSEQHGDPWQAPGGGGEPAPVQPGYGQQPYGQPQQYQYGQPQPYGQPQQYQYGQPQQYAQPQPYGQPQQYGQPQGYPRSDYARWGRRVAAFLLDDIPTFVGLIIFYIGYGFFIADMVRTGTTALTADTPGLVPMIIGWVIMLAGTGWAIYNRWITGGRTGQSWGKRVMKIKLVSEQTGAPIGALNAFLRDLIHVVDSLPIYIGYLWPLWDDKRQTFADKLMNTIVVDAAPTTDSPTAG